MAAPQVLVVGSYNQDCSWRVERAPQAGETVRGHGFASAHGGKGYNQAVACARQAAPTTFIAALGSDAAAEAAQRAAAAEGITTCWQRHAERATGTACILVEDGGQNRIVVALGANEALGEDFLVAQEAVFAASRILLVQLENNIEATRTACALARRHGLLCMLNPAPVHAGLDAALLGQVDLLIPNETEFTLLLERIAGLRVAADDLARHSDAELHALARRLGVGSVIITLGAQGCFVSHGAAARVGDA
ncbi:MAG: ribokinase, partial [Dokdonella sp.]|nr:ribokinase [Dokdonella sp.]